MRRGTRQREVHNRVSRVGRLAFSVALVSALFVGVVPAWAALSGAGSATVVAGNATSVSITTDVPGGSIGVSGSHGGIAVSGGGAGPTVTFRFTVALSTAAGSYPYTFTDGQSAKPFTLNVTAAPVTTTTTQPPTTTTTTTRPATTTTRPATTTTTEPPTTTTTTTTEPPTTTTTVPPTTTTTEPPTTTTLPPTTTTSSTLVPASIAALGDSEGGNELPLPWIGGAAALLALIAGGAFIYSRRKPAYGSASSGVVIAMKNRSQERKAKTLSRPSRGAGLRNWWRTSGPVVSFHEWRSSRDATKSLNRKIEERRRLRGD